MGILAAFAVPHPPLLIPGIGEDSSAQVQKTKNAYKEAAARSAALRPETLVIFSPHTTLYADYFHVSPGKEARGDFGRYGPLGAQASYSVSYDTEFVEELEQRLACHEIPGGTAGEQDPALDHGAMVPLHFFEQALSAQEKKEDKNTVEAEGLAAAKDRGSSRVRVVRIGLSGLSREQHHLFGKTVAETANILNRRTIVIASGDLSHKLLAEGPYGYASEGPEFDRQLCDALAQGDFARVRTIDKKLSKEAAECGLLSFIMMGGALEEVDYTSELLSYEGPFGVGYAVAAYIAREGGSTKRAQGASLPVALARRALSIFFFAGKRRPSIFTSDIQNMLKGFQENQEDSLLYHELAQSRGGVFVSLHKEGKLRGCIGTIGARMESVLEEIIQNAVSAAVEDPRFPPLEEKELSDLDIKVDILQEAKPVADKSMLDAQRYGVIVKLGWRKGVLLPALKGVDTPDEQIAIALAKAGIEKDEPYELECFEVVRYT